METIYYSRVKSPLGPLLLGTSAKGLAVLAFGHDLPPRLGGENVAWRESAEATTDVRFEIEEYFAGRQREFTLPLDLRGTDFQRRCWAELRRIPYGETRSYAQIARAVGHPAAYRAVGQSNHHNPVAIVVPCHRVLAGGKALGGYGGGLAAKAFLLRLEGASFRDPVSAREAQRQLTFK